MSHPVPALITQQGEPVGAQLLRAVPSLRNERFSPLLDFESNRDAIFCATTGGSGSIASDKPHTGRAAYKIDSNVSQFTVKLSAVLVGRPFPESWILVGGYFYSNRPTTIKVHLDPVPKGSQPHEVQLVGGAWTPVFVELPNSPQPTIPLLSFDLRSPHDTLWCDDVLLIDNYKLYTGPGAALASSSSSVDTDPPDGAMPAWFVMRRGLSYIGSAAGQFDFKLLTSETSPGGWSIDEANPMRARFHSSSSTSLTVYADGRAFWDGQYKPMSAAGRDPIFDAQHHSPAQIEVSEGMGRVDRNTPGDLHNDGYNEATGSYRIIATGPRIELRFTPKSTAVLSPILEISGLPFGKALITLEGRLIEQSTRTSSGTLLVELPAKIDRAVTVDIRIEE